MNVIFNDRIILYEEKFKNFIECFIIRNEETHTKESNFSSIKRVVVKNFGSMRTVVFKFRKYISKTTW